jgi:hypothetical protein
MHWLSLAKCSWLSPIFHFDIKGEGLPVRLTLTGHTVLKQIDVTLFKHM